MPHTPSEINQDALQRSLFLQWMNKYILINNLPFNPCGMLIRTALDTGAMLGELLGHSTITITMDTYSDVMPEHKKEALE